MYTLYWSYYLSILLVLGFIRLILFFVKVKPKRVDQNAIVEVENDEAMDYWHSGFNCSHTQFDFKKFSKSESLRRSEEYYELMNKRRSVRQFSKETVPIEIIYNIIKTAGKNHPEGLNKVFYLGTSPSGAHTEPWTFVLVKSHLLKCQIRSIIEEQEEINYKKRMSRQWVEDLKFLKTFWVKEYITDAPYLIMVFKQLYSINKYGKKQMHYYNEESVNLATGILLTAIHYAGLFTVTTTPLNCGPALKTLVGRPASEKLCFLFPVGYPSKNCLIPDIKRKPVQDVLVVK